MGFFFAARVLVILAGLLFGREGMLLLAGGWTAAYWGLILAGTVFALVSVFLVCFGLAPNRNKLCKATVAFVAEVLFRILG